jgi:hypothetical protein
VLRAKDPTDDPAASRVGCALLMTSDGTCELRTWAWGVQRAPQGIEEGPPGAGAWSFYYFIKKTGVTGVWSGGTGTPFKKGVVCGVLCSISGRHLRAGRDMRYAPRNHIALAIGWVAVRLPNGDHLAVGSSSEGHAARHPASTPWRTTEVWGPSQMGSCEVHSNKSAWCVLGLATTACGVGGSESTPCPRCPLCLGPLPRCLLPHDPCRSL